MNAPSNAAEIDLANEANVVQTNLQGLRAYPAGPGALEFLAEARKLSKARAKALKEQQDEALRPMRESEQAIRRWFRPVLDAYDRVKDAIDARILEIQREQTAQQQAAVNAVTQAFEQGRTPDTLQLATAVQAPAKVDGMHVRETWDFELFNPALVPAEFCSPDPAKILAYIKSTNGNAVPGCRVFKKQTVYGK